MKIKTLLPVLILLPFIVQSQKVGVGTMNPLARLDIQGDSMSLLPVINAEARYISNADIIAVQGRSYIGDGWGIGGVFQGGYIGMSASVDAADYGGGTYGVIGSSTGLSGTGTRIGLYGIAYGGAENWAGYFDGRGRFTDSVEMDRILTVEDDIFGNRNLWVSDTANIDEIHSSPLYDLQIRGGRNIDVTIDRNSDPNFAGAFFVRNGDFDEAFGVDENGNARTYGSHYVDLNLGIGTQSPNDRLHIENGNIRLQGLAPYHVFNTTSPGLPCGIHFNENGSLEGALYYEASKNTLNLTNNFFQPGLVLDLTNNSVRIGANSSATGYKLSVDGKIMGEELRIMNSASWPDYVFHEDYDLMSLEEVENEIKRLGHLPGVPSAEEVEEKGIEVGEMQKRMMEKIEELTLYILDQEKRITSLELQLKTKSK